MNIELWLIVVMCAASYVGGLLSAFVFEWHPVDREIWGDHVARLREWTWGRITFWVAMAALLLAAFALVVESRRSAAMSDYVECKAKYDQASAELTDARLFLLENFVRATNRVVFVAVNGQDPAAALKRLNETGDDYLTAELPELPQEVCGTPEE